MKKRKKIDRNAAMLAVASAPVATYGATPYESSRQRFDREEAEDIARRKEAAEATLAPIKAEITENLRKLRAEQAAALFTSESAELMSRCKQIRDDQFAGMSVEKCRQLISEAFTQFRAVLEDSQGVRLEASALQKLQIISRKNLGIDLTDATVWAEVYAYADSLGVFDSHDVTQLKVTAQPQPVGEEPIDVDSAIESLDTTTRDGQKRARTILANHLFSVDAKSVFDEWITSLSNNFDFIPTEDQQRFAIDLFIEKNLSFLSRRSYDDVRKVLVARGIFPERCLTNDDRAAILVESTDARSYQERQDLKAKLALLREGKRPL